MNNEEKILLILTQVQADIAGLKEGQTVMQADIDSLKEGQTVMQADIGGLKTDVSNLRAGQAEIIKKVDSITEQVQDLTESQAEIRINTNRLIVDNDKQHKDLSKKIDGVKTVIAQNVFDIGELKATIAG